VNTAASSGHALEKALAAKLRELLGSVPMAEDVQVSQNPAPFDRIFDIEARATLPTGNVAELWVVCHDLRARRVFPTSRSRTNFTPEVNAPRGCRCLRLL